MTQLRNRMKFSIKSVFMGPINLALARENLSVDP